MRKFFIGGNIDVLLQRARQWQARLLRAGLPALMAGVPLWLLSLHYSLVLDAKAARVARIARRIVAWQGTVAELTGQERVRLEFIDLDHGIRNDVGAAREAMEGMCRLCLDVCHRFAELECKPAILRRSRQRFLDAIEQAAAAAEALIAAIAAHDRRALALRQQLHAVEQAQRASAAAHALRAPSA